MRFLSASMSAMMAAMTAAMMAGALLSGAAAAADPGVPEVPSGQQVRLFDLFIEEQDTGARWARFRFVAPKLAEGVDFATVEADFPHLCAAYALPLLADAGEAVEQVVISLSSAEVEFGANDPGVVQFFEAYRIEKGACIWEAF